MNLDETDRKLLTFLQEDCKQPVQKLGKKLGLSKTAVHYRINKLEKTGVIKNYSAVLDPEKVGLPSTAIVLIAVPPANILKKEGIHISKIFEELAKIPNVAEVQSITGPYDIMIKIHGCSLHGVDQDFVDNLRDINGISGTHTCVVMKTIKDTHLLNIPKQEKA